MTDLPISVYNELLQHAITTLEDMPDMDIDDLHFHAFNEDDYIVGHYNAEQWLKRHDISVFGAITEIIEWEQATLGEVNLKPEYINAERIVNLYTLIAGETVLADFDLKSETLLDDMREVLGNDCSE